MIFEVILLFIGQIAAAVSIFFIRASELAPGYLAAYRLMIAVLILSPLFIRDLKKISPEIKAEGKSVPLHFLGHSLLPGMILGFHFIFWNIGARLTVSANATLFVNMTPIVMPIVIFALTREKPKFMEIVASLIAISGAVLLSISDFSVSVEYLKGDIFALIAMIFLTVYLALSRRNKKLPFFYYICGVYFFGSITAFTASALSGAPLLGERGWIELIPVVLLALISTLIGHNLINRAMRKISSQIVGVGQLSQFLWVGIIAWLLYRELPEPIFYPSMGLISIGNALMIYIHSKPREKRNGSDLS